MKCDSFFRLSFFRTLKAVVIESLRQLPVGQLHD